jgi:hypothetical protein
VSPSDGSAALRLAITALGRSGGLSGGGTSGPPTVELVRLREAGGLDASAAGDAAGGRVVTLCDGVIPRPVEAERLAALVRGGASLLVLVGPETIGSPDRGRFSDWLESLAGIGLAGAIDCEGGRIAGDFTGSAGRPSPMLPQDVAKLLHKAEEKADEAPRLKINFKKGDRVKINEGTFENFEGEVEQIDEANGRVTVMLSIFGRSTPVDIEYWQIESV